MGDVVGAIENENDEDIRRTPGVFDGMGVWTKVLPGRAWQGGAPGKSGDRG